MLYEFKAGLFEIFSFLAQTNTITGLPSLRKASFDCEETKTSEIFFPLNFKGTGKLLEWGHCPKVACIQVSFHRLGPLGRVVHKVAMSVFKSYDNFNDNFCPQLIRALLP